MKKGQFFLLVGNSGSGKDSLLKEALAHWPQNISPVKVPRRYITRPSHETEPFHSITSGDFAKKKADNEFCLTWHVYGLDYGVPKEVEDWVKNGDLVIVNVSRAIISEARAKIPNLKVIFVQVPFKITLERIKSRGRESKNDIVFKERVKRAKNNQNLPEADFIVDNSGDLTIGGKKLLNYLLSFVEK